MKNVNNKVIVIALISSLVSCSANACDIANSQYQLLTSKLFNAEFVFSNLDNELSEPLLHITSTKTKQNYWFRFNHGNGYSSMSLTPVESPEKTNYKVIDLNKPQSLHQPIYFINKDLSFNHSELKKNMKAPQYFLTTNLAEVLWYGASNLGATVDTKESMPRAFFKMSKCVKR